MHQLILVGGLGFVGRNIIHECTNTDLFSKFNMFAIDNLTNAEVGYENLSNIKIFEGDYQSDQCMDFIGDETVGSRTFVFLAGETRVAESKDRPVDFIKANISEPSEFVLNNIKQNDHFILISTAGALFDGHGEIDVHRPYSPKNFYGASKAAEELILEKLVELKGATFSIVRLTNVYGIYSSRKKSAIHMFSRAAIDDNTITINGDGMQTRDFIYSLDVGFGILMQALKFVNKDEIARINMLGSGSSINLWDVVFAVELASDKKLKYRQVTANTLLSTEPRDVVASKDDILDLLGNRITSFQDGINSTYEYYKNLKKLK